MPSLAEADTVIASSARPIRAIRLIQCPPVRMIAMSGTSSLWNVCSGAHEVNSKAGIRAAFPVQARPGSAVRSRAAVHYRPPARAMPFVGVAVEFSGKIGNVRPMVDDRRGE